MAEFERYGKYYVLKNDDIKKLLTRGEIFQLQQIALKIAQHRSLNGKKPYNNYVVINEDESYAEKVWSLIEESYREKI